MKTWLPEETLEGLQVGRSVPARAGPDAFSRPGTRPHPSSRGADDRRRGVSRKRHAPLIGPGTSAFGGEPAAPGRDLWGNYDPERASEVLPCCELRSCLNLDQTAARVSQCRLMSASACAPARSGYRGRPDRLLVTQL